MAHIEHTGISVKDQEKVADFYKKTFGMVEVKRLTEPGQGRGIFLSDGHINLAILYCDDNGREGINHFGFKVDNVKEAEAAALANGALRGLKAVPQDGRFSEGNIQDPTGQSVDLSANGWQTRLD